MTKRNIGITLLFVSILMWAIGRFTQLNSEFIGKLYCGDRYMKPVDGIVGDVSCGFNADMYLVAFVFCLLVVVVFVGIL
jgi:hypothetical protein